MVNTTYIIGLIDTGSGQSQQLVATVNGGILACTATDTLPTFISNVSAQSNWNETDTNSLNYIKNKPVLSFSIPTFSSATTATQLSTTRNAQVLYTFPTSMTSLLTSQALTATLQYADDAGFTTNVVTVNSDVQGCSGILSLVLTGRLQVQGIIPAGKYRKVTLAQSGGATVPTTLTSGQEVLL